MARVGLRGGKSLTFSSGSQKGQKAAFTLGHPPQSRQCRQGFPGRESSVADVCVVQECETLSRELLSPEDTPESPIPTNLECCLLLWAVSRAEEMDHWATGPEIIFLNQMSHLLSV